jgi:Transcription factor WhiB
MTTRTRPSITNPENKQEPMWFRIGRRRPITDEFKNNHRSACINWQEVMFDDEDLSNQVIARKLCASCVNFKSCALWALYGHCDTEFAIVAGMDPDQRRRIREGRESFWDWRREFNYAQRAAKAAKHTRARNGVRKRDQRRDEIPLCRGCDSNQYVHRDGRDKSTDRQRFKCTDCGSYFLGEEL